MSAELDEARASAPAGLEALRRIAIVPAFNEEQNIGRVLDEPALQQRLSVAGRAHVLDRYTWAETARQMAQIVRDCAA